MTPEELKVYRKYVNEAIWEVFTNNLKKDPLWKDLLEGTGIFERVKGVK